MFLNRKELYKKNNPTISKSTLNEIVFEVYIPNDNTRFVMGRMNDSITDRGTIDFNIDWGNGHTSVFDTANPFRTPPPYYEFYYYYQKKGTYTVRMYNREPKYNSVLSITFNNDKHNGSGTIPVLDRENHLITKVIKVSGNEYAGISLWNMFQKCKNLRSIDPNAFDDYPNLTEIERLFGECSNLTEIPNELFSKNKKLKNLTSTFNKCTNLKFVGEKFLEKNTNLTHCNYVFKNCTSLINRPKPHGLEMWQIAGTNGRPNNIYMSEIFKNCTAMPDYASLPASVK